MKQGVFRVMLLLLGITAGFGGVRPSVSDGSEPDTVSSPELDSLASFFAGVQSRHPEKLYLHLNQPYYGAGDTMWFKAYLTDAVSHRPDTLPAGEYTLRAYTGWMLNFEPAFFFRRNINVGNTRSDRIRTDITYTSAQAIVRFADADGRPIRDAEADYELFDRNGKREKVRVEIGLKDDGGKPIEADLSVSVTDRRAVRYDFLGN